MLIFKEIMISMAKNLNQNLFRNSSIGIATLTIIKHSAITK